ncbi:hypothetical protein CBC_A1395 [Clostridium botulinum C str. Eklund]|nr:hypothetical protein CBC_A1395 [Clostridium botulinum C str. Eklund]
MIFKVIDNRVSATIEPNRININAPFHPNLSAITPILFLNYKKYINFKV